MLQIGDVVRILDDKRFFIIHDFFMSPATELDEVEFPLFSKVDIYIRTVTPVLGKKKATWKQSGKTSYSLTLINPRQPNISYIDEKPYFDARIGLCTTDEIKKVGSTTLGLKKKKNMLQQKIKEFSSQLEDLDRIIAEREQLSFVDPEVFADLVKGKLI